MSRATSGVVSKKRHKKVLKLAKGFRGRAKNCFRVAVEKVEKAFKPVIKKIDFAKNFISRVGALV